MAAWDLVVDPILSGPTVGAWVWERGGPYYGVPVQNSLGWIVTSFTVYLLYRSVERRWTLQPVGPLSSRSWRDHVLADGPMKVGSPVPAQQAPPGHGVRSCNQRNGDVRFGSTATIWMAPAPHVDGDPFRGSARSRRPGAFAGFLVAALSLCAEPQRATRTLDRRAPE
jgi:hypothetical protein